MPTLHLGVLDVPYAAGGISTGDVAEILESRYHIAEHFMQMHGQQVADALCESAQGALESIILGAPASSRPLLGGEQAIETMFRQMLTSAELEGMGYPGIPTQASIERRTGISKSKRFKRKSKASRTGPSFVDTGTYRSSLRAWVD